MTRTTEYLKYAAYYTCLNAWSVEEAPTIHEMKEILRDDGISNDTINRFLPESKFKTIIKNIPGIEVRPYRSLSESILLPSDISLVKAYVDWYHAKCDKIILYRKVKDPEFRKFADDCKTGSPYLGKKWAEIKNRLGIIKTKVAS